jgi:hypothetical protein
LIDVRTNLEPKPLDLSVRINLIFASRLATFAGSGIIVWVDRASARGTKTAWDEL